MTRRRIRRLTSEERALWHHVVRAVTPLRPDPVPEVAPVPAAPPEAAPPEAASPDAPALRPVTGAPPVQTPALARLPLAPIEPRLRRRLGRGAEVDARIDLHGLTQAAAHHRLHAFLAQAQRHGHSVVLVITGKGGEKAAGLDELRRPDGSERGVLRRAVPLWLGEPGLRSLVLGFETASRAHGGEGALYVRIRRRRAVP